MLQFKEKRFSQAEAGRNYKACEQVTKEIMSLKKVENESLKLENGCLNRKPNMLEDEKQKLSKHQDKNRNQSHLI